MRLHQSVPPRAGALTAHAMQSMAIKEFISTTAKPELMRSRTVDARRLVEILEDAGLK
jgi:hypothetical protein